MVMFSLKLSEHAGWDVGATNAHSPNVWWIYDARETSPKTCSLCLTLHGHQFRGDGLDYMFPYHIHLRVNAIKAMVHPNCRCILRWAGRTEEPTTHAIVGGFTTRKIKDLPEEAKVRAGQLSPFQKVQKRKILQ